MTSPELPRALAVRYEPLALLGSGAYGAVYRCLDRELRRPVAVKVLHHTFDERHRERFRREALALAGIKHPHVVTVYDHGLTPEGPYLVMEHLVGEPLPVLGPGEALRAAMLQVAEGLEAIHRAGVIHRDLKPANVLLTREGRAVLVDFGMARDAGWASITDSQFVVGTVCYMSPEMMCGEPVGPAADWYSYGATFYAAAEGRPPYSVQQVLCQRLGAFPEDPPFAALDRDGPEARTLLSCLARDPLARPGRAAAVRTLLEAREHEPTRPLAPPHPGPAVPGPSPPPDAGGKSRSPAGTPSGGPPRFLAAALVLALAGAGAAVLGRTGLGPGEARPDPARIPDPAAWPAELEEALREEFLARPHRPGPPPDPLDAMDFEADHESLARFRAWVRAGGRPEDLPPGVRDLLGRADAACRAAGRPGPFAPFFLPDPRAGPRPVPEWLARPAAEAGLELRELRGWTAAAVTLAERLDRSWESAKEGMGAGRGLPGELARSLPPAFALDPGVGVRAAFSSPELRPWLAVWLAPLNELHEAAWYAAGRAVLADPDRAELVALACAEFLSSRRAAGFGPATFIPPEERIPLPSGSGAMAYLVAWLHHVRTELRHRPGLDHDFETLHAAELEAWRGAVACPARPDPVGAVRVAEAWRWAAMSLRQRHRAAALVGFYRAVRDRLACLGPRDRAALAAAVREAARAPGAEVLAPEESAELERLAGGP